MLRGRKPNIANKMYQCNKNYCQSAYTKARLSYNGYDVNTSVAVQQCDLYRTSSIFKVGFTSILVWRVTVVGQLSRVQLLLRGCQSISENNRNSCLPRLLWSIQVSRWCSVDNCDYIIRENTDISSRNWRFCSINSLYH